MIQKPIRAILIAVMLFPLVLHAQKETTYVYYNALWKPTVKDSAAFYTRQYWLQNLLHKETFRADSNIAIMAGSYLDSAAKTEQGFFTRYRSGIIRDSIFYDKGVRKEGWFFYSNGRKKAYFHATAPDVYDVQRGWDEEGKEITPFVFARPAIFPGGDSAWKNYLVQGLVTNQPAEYVEGKISGVVWVQFSILQDGTVSDVRVRTSSGHEVLDKHAMEVIRNSPKWIPAIQFNKNVRFFQKQALTYTAQQQQ
jgi:TonB family protein